MSSQSIISAPRIAVTGASGQLGRIVIERLLAMAAGAEIIGLVRSEAAAAGLTASGAQARIANYEDAASIAAALAGVDRVLLISSSEIGRRVPQHANVIEAAKQANVGFLAYTSILHADRNPMMLAAEHRETETLIRASGVPWAFLRNGWYTENYALGIGAALEHGVMIGAAGSGRLSTAARADYADAAAAVMSAPSSHNGAVYELVGDEAYTLADFAGELSRQTGKPVAYHNLSEEAYKAQLMSFGLPEAFAGALADSDARASEGALFDPGRALSRLIGRPTTPMAETIAGVLKSMPGGGERSQPSA